MRKASPPWADYDAGTHYLEINAECSWTLKVTGE